MTGYPSTALLGDKAISYNEIIHPEDRQFVFDSVKDTISESKQYEMEYRIITKSGDEKWVWEKGLLIADNSEDKPFLEGIIIDITDRKKLEQLLILSEKKYRKLFENMSAGFAYHEMIYDEKGKPIDYRYLEVNDEFEVLTGIKKEEVIGKTVCEVLPDIKKDDFDWIRAYGKVTDSGESSLLEDQYSESLDKWYSVVVYSPEKGTFVTIFLDITDRKKMEEKLREALGELEVSNKELQRLNNFMIGRELRMRELKMRIKELEESVNND